MTRWDETWHRLLEWTHGHSQAERLAIQLLYHEGFQNIDPSHPLGGKDNGRDGTCTKEGEPWCYAVYFPRGQQTFTTIKRKFVEDLKAAAKHDAGGFAFITNQELMLAERSQLKTLCGDARFELCHLERATAILDRPFMAGVRQQFLDIEPEPVPYMDPGPQLPERPAPNDHEMPRYPECTSGRFPTSADFAARDARHEAWTRDNAKRSTLGSHCAWQLDPILRSASGERAASSTPPQDSQAAVTVLRSGR
ncbi:hypothetical protein KHQ06_15885 [Nocardia tengchongensis]|uniref:Restriction endonuclease n=1 Tax=Nocardia tengchongensis TaxID=2055889 RepID=A0ABX8D063_9NOCA|nr:hypothetical protein [Nocardia tengchongensis]QVI24120.1 hypothetical protein KHQ06_15885 [Nocardia tengchongensis]